MTTVLWCFPVAASAASASYRSGFFFGWSDCPNQKCIIGVFCHLCFYMNCMYVSVAVVLLSTTNTVSSRVPCMVDPEYESGRCFLIFFWVLVLVTIQSITLHWKSYDSVEMSCQCSRGSPGRQTFPLRLHRISSSPIPRTT